MLLKRKIGLLLAAVCMMQCGISCSNSFANSDHGSSVTDGSNVLVTEPPTFESVNMEGDELVFLTINRQDLIYNDNYIFADVSAGDKISKTVAERNSLVKQMYNVNIIAEQVYIPKTEVENRIKSGQVDFDIVYDWGTRLGVMALNGYLYDFNNVESIDLNRSYWVPSTRNDLTVRGRMYMATNYITMNGVGWSDFLLYNKTMYEDLGHSVPLSSLVDTNSWTLDKYIELAVSASNDIDGDGLNNAEDRYGIFGDLTGTLTSLARYSGVTNTVEEFKGSYSLSVYNETVVDIYKKFNDALSSSNAIIGYDNIFNHMKVFSGFSSRYSGARYFAFGESHVLFMPSNMGILTEFKDMEDNFGILPNPLYSKDQKSYYHYIDPKAPLFALPAGGEDHEATGMVLEYMAYLSELKLYPIFLESTVSARKSVDEADIRMVGIIKNSLRYNWTDIYGLDVTNSILGKMMSTGNFGSVYKKFADEAKAEVDSYISTISKIPMK